MTGSGSSGLWDSEQGAPLHSPPHSPMAHIGQSGCPVWARAWLWVSVGLQVTAGELPLLACVTGTQVCVGDSGHQVLGGPVGCRADLRGSGAWLWPGFSLGSRGAGRESGVP